MIEESYTNFINSDSKQNFNKNWKFYLGDQPGAYLPSFSDDNFANINLPHDYSLDQDFSPYFEAESAYKPGGVGNYRKSFVIDDINLEEKQVFIYFDGVYQNSSTYINGEKLGFNPYGYNPFAYELTPYLKKDGENLLAVTTNHQVPSSRWYSGSGIYRSVDILVKDRLNFGIYGPKIDYEIDDKYAKVNVKAQVSNNYKYAKTFKIKHYLYFQNKLIKDITSEEITIDTNSKKDIDLDFEAHNISLWDLDKPNLYQLKSEILLDGVSIDENLADIGFRSLEKYSQKGISLNGKNIKIKGVCLHHDNGALGACDYRSALEYKVNILKDMGANTIRLSHNPASKTLIDICNKKGILVVSEIFDGWILDKNNNYNDFSTYFEKEIGQSNLLYSNPSMTYAEFSLKEVLKRDYNSLAVFMISIGNEIMEGTDWSSLSRYPSVAESLIKWAREVDTKRWLTIGDNIIRYDYVDELIDIDDKVNKASGMVGLNYTEGERYDKIHKDYPDWVLWASETASNINSRSVYDRFELDYLPKDRRLSSYDTSKVAWGSHASDAWYDIITRDYVAGEAVWTGFDYLGEPTPFNGVDRGPVDNWPSPRSSYFGIIDLAGFPKDAYYLYRSLWNDKDITCHLLPSWNEDEVIVNDGKVKVICYTNASSVELVHKDQNGKIKSYGKKYFVGQMTKAGHKYKTNNARKRGFSLYAQWEIPFEEGSIQAIAYDEKGRLITQTVGNSLRSTSGKPAKIMARANKDALYKDSYDLAYVTIDVVDENDNLITNADNLINVEVSENGVLLALDNGFQEDMDSFKVCQKKAYAGKLLAIIGGKAGLDSIEVKITSPGLEEAILKIDLKENPNTFNIREAIYKDPKTPAFIGELSILNYSTTTLPNIYPRLPKKLELVDKKGKLSGNYIDISWDDINEDDLREEGQLLVKGYGDFGEERVEAIAFVRVEGEKQIINADIANLALIKEVDNEQITLGYATQQVFAKLVISKVKNPDIKIYASEAMTYDKGTLINYQMTKNKGEYTYKFDPIKATYITIVFEDKACKLENITLYNVKKLARIYNSTEFESIEVNDYKLSDDELKAREYICGGKIEVVSINPKENAAITTIRRKKKWIIYLQSEDSSKIRKFTIKKGTK